jgi:uncharacterized protein YidB (DUF937 family)
MSCTPCSLFSAAVLRLITSARHSHGRQQSGHSDTVNSWVGTGANKAISPGDLASALGADKINALMSQSGMSRDDLLQGLSQYLPQVVDQLTPRGRLPTEQEAARLL